MVRPGFVIFVPYANQRFADVRRMLFDRRDRCDVFLDTRASIGGGRGDASPHFSAWGDSIGIVPPPTLFSSEKLRGI